MSKDRDQAPSTSLVVVRQHHRHRLAMKTRFATMVTNEGIKSIYQGDHAPH
jgi:hypothetical protein